MDKFEYQINGKKILVYRSIYAPVKSNMFVILSGKEAVVFDPNVDEKLIALLDSNGIKKILILLTHGHFDHTSGVNWLKENSNAELLCQSKCAKKIVRERGNVPQLVAFVLSEEDRKDGGHRYKDFRENFKPYSIKADRIFEKEERFNVEDLEFHASSTPGHCPGSACYRLFDIMVFTGDTLLQFDPVITRFPESDELSYKEISLPFLENLPKDSIIMPGHGDPFILKDTNNI